MAIFQGGVITQYIQYLQFVPFFDAKIYPFFKCKILTGVNSRSITLLP